MQNRPVLSLVSGIVLLCFALLGSGGLAACIDYQAQVNQAVRAHDLDSLEPLFATVKTHCPRNYLEWLRRSMAQIAAAKADSLTQQGRLEEADEWLKRAPTVVWATQVIRGDIAARRKHWQAAAQYYNQALDLIADEEATPQAPSETVIQKVFQLASQAQVLVGNIDDTVSRSGEASGMMLGNIRGFKPTSRLIPIHFAYDASVLSEKGKKAARQLATYIKQYNFKEITLIGHTDSKGSEEYNYMLSQKRAVAVSAYLRQAGVSARIRTDGKGESEPLQLDNPASYTPAEIDALNRRVEFVIQ
jgi:outer membrane protein OmpA-like peptidoglycan-associated protein